VHLDAARTDAASPGKPPLLIFPQILRAASTEVARILATSSGVSRPRHSFPISRHRPAMASKLAAAVVPRCTAFSDAGIRTIWSTSMGGGEKTD